MPCHLKEPSKIQCFGREKSLNFTYETAGNIGQVGHGEFIEVEFLTKETADFPGVQEVSQGILPETVMKAVEDLAVPWLLRPL